MSTMRPLLRPFVSGRQPLGRALQPLISSRSNQCWPLASASLRACLHPPAVHWSNFPKQPQQQHRSLTTSSNGRLADRAGHFDRFHGADVEHGCSHAVLPYSRATIWAALHDARNSMGEDGMASIMPYCITTRFHDDARFWRPFLTLMRWKSAKAIVQDGVGEPGDRITADFLVVNTALLHKASKFFRVTWTLRTAREPSYYAENDDDDGDTPVPGAARDGAEDDEPEVVAGDRTEVMIEVAADLSFTYGPGIMPDKCGWVATELGLTKLESWIDGRQQQQQQEHPHPGDFEHPQPRRLLDKIWAALANFTFLVHKFRYFVLLSYVWWDRERVFTLYHSMGRVAQAAGQEIEKEEIFKQEDKQRWGRIAGWILMCFCLAYNFNVFKSLP